MMSLGSQPSIDGERVKDVLLPYLLGGIFEVYGDKMNWILNDYDLIYHSSGCRFQITTLLSAPVR